MDSLYTSGSTLLQPVASSSVPSLSLTSLASRRPVRPDRQGRISASKRRPVSVCLTQHHKPPFLAYGAADVEDSLALHRTHNVLAPTDVSCYKYFWSCFNFKLMKEGDKFLCILLVCSFSLLVCSFSFPIICSFLKDNNLNLCNYGTGF